MSNQQAFIEGLQRAWHKERATELIYHSLAERETNAARQKVLLKLAETERGHAERWAKRLAELNVALPEFSETLQEKTWRWVLVQSGMENAINRIESAEDEDIDMYSTLEKLAPSDADRQAVASVRHDEETHSGAAHQFATPAADPLTPQNRLDVILGREKWHKHSGGWIGQAIYGANDGLGSVFGIVSGVAGATAGGPAVLIAGLAGMLASALSMGSGAYLASKAEREVHQAEIGRERRELEIHPEEEQEELELFYQLKGMPEETAHTLAVSLIANHDEALKTLVSEELGLSEQTFPNPWVEAGSATISTALGAFIPIIPFFFTHGYPAVIASFAISTLAHFLIGAAKTVVTGLNPWKSGLEMTLVGLGEASVTYALGLLFGKAVGG